VHPTPRHLPQPGLPGAVLARQPGDGVQVPRGIPRAELAVREGAQQAQEGGRMRGEHVAGLVQEVPQGGGRPGLPQVLAELLTAWKQGWRWARGQRVVGYGVIGKRSRGPGGKGGKGGKRGVPEGLVQEIPLRKGPLKSCRTSESLKMVDRSSDNAGRKSVGYGLAGS